MGGANQGAGVAIMGDRSALPVVSIYLGIYLGILGTS